MNVYHPKLTAGFWLLGMVIIAVLASQVFVKDWLETSFLALLPSSEQNPQIAKAVQQHNLLVNKKVVWLVGAKTADAAIDQAKQLKLQLLQSQLFNQITLEFSGQDYIKQYQQLFAYRYQLLDGQSRQMLAANPEGLLKQNLQILHSPVGQALAVNLGQDPALLFGRYFNAQHPMTMDLQQGVLMVSDQQWVYALVLTELQDERLQLDKLEILLTLVQAATSQVQAQDGQLLVSGMPLFTAYGAQSAKHEIALVGIGSSVGIILLLWLTFRSIRPLLLSVLAIGSGLSVALVLSILIFGKIHILTLVFGASLIGVADDYAQHFLCDSLGEKDWNPRKSLAFILPGLSLGLINNLLSYAGLSFSPFPGLQEVAVFSGIGLLAAWLTVVLVFPLLLSGFEFKHEPKLLKLTRLWEQRWPFWLIKNKRWISLVLFGFIVGGIGLLVPKDDVRLLQSAPLGLLKTAEKIKTLLPTSRDNQFFLVSGKDQAEWYEHEQNLVRQLQQIKSKGRLANFEALSQYWPDQATQQQNYQLLKRGLISNGLLKRYMGQLGFDKQAISLEHKQFAEASAQSLTLAHWLQVVDESKQALWLGCDAGPCESTVALTGISQVPELLALQHLPGVLWVDQVQDLSALFARYRVRASALLASAFSVAFVGLALRFGWRQAVSVMSVPVLSLAVALAMLGWCHQLFSLFNLFALLLVLGIGVDYGLFFFMAGKRRTSTSLGVTLSALTTLLAFGLLAVSATEIVHAFGFTLTAGIITALLCSPLVGFRRQNDG